MLSADLSSPSPWAALSLIACFPVAAASSYTWRATRLIMTTRSNWLHDLSNGQLDKVVDKIKLEAAAKETPTSMAGEAEGAL